MFCTGRPTHAAVGPVWNPERSAEVCSSDLPGEARFWFPRFLRNCRARNLQLPVSGFAFDCNVMLFLTGEGSQLSLIGALMRLCQGPRAPPGGKRLRPGSKFHSGVNYKGPSLQNDKTPLTSARFAAGPKERSCRVTQVCA